MEDILSEDFWKSLYAENSADPDLQGVLLDSETIVAQGSTNQELHGTVYQQGVLQDVSTNQKPDVTLYQAAFTANIFVVFENTMKTFRATLEHTLGDLKTKMEKCLGIPFAKQVLSFKNSVLEDDGQKIFSITGITNGSHIELTICEDDTARWSSNKRVKLMLKDRSLETVADTLDGVRSEISKRMVLLSNGKELHSDADYKALLLSGNAELELIFSTSPTAPATTYTAAPTFTDASASSLTAASASALVPAFSDASASALPVSAITSALVPAFTDASTSGLIPAFTDASLVPAFNDAFPDASPVPAFTDTFTDASPVPAFTDTFTGVTDASLVPAFTDTFTGATNASLVPAFTDVSASANLPASSSQAAAKQPLKLGGQGTENNLANVSIFVELNGGMLASVQVNKSHKVSVLRDVLAEEQKNHPTLAGLIPEHYLFTKEGCMILEDISFIRNSVKKDDTIRIVSQPGEVGPLENDKFIKILVSRRTSMSTNKMVMEIFSSKTAGAIKVELAKKRWVKELGFTIPMFYSFWLFREQASTGHLFQLSDTTSLRLQRVEEGDTLFVVPKEPLKLKVRLNWRTVHVHQVKATEVVRKLRQMLERIGDEMFPLPSQPYDFEYKGERIMDEGKPFYWHHIVGDDELMIHIVPSLL